VRIVTVVGTRPQLIKLAALQPALRRLHDELFVDTGQHWDDLMAGNFFAELSLPRPHHSLGIGGGSGLEQTGRMLLALEPVLAAAAPDAVLVVGDTNSTLAGALAGARLGIPVAHVEAGLRSHDRQMPEETNRWWRTISRAGRSPRRRPRWQTCARRGSSRGFTWSAT
jgi:UDP-N-acetylglucosamine 2-epimerase